MSNIAGKANTVCRLLIIQESMGGGGAERALVSLLGRIDRRRFDVRVLLLTGGGTLEGELPAGVSTGSIFKRRIPKGLWRVPSSLLHKFLRRRAMRLIGDFRPDVILSFIEGEAVVLHTALYGLARRNMTWVHTDLVANPWTRPIISRADEGRFYRMIDSVLCVSQGAANALTQLYSPDRKRINVVPNVIDAEMIRKEATEGAFDKEGFNIIAVGRLAPVKRYDRLLQAAAILAKRGADFTLNILGEGDERERLESLALQLGIKEKVNFCGFISNPYPAMAAADMYVLSSDAEGFPLVVAEALSLGRPVVSTRVTGPDEMLADGAGVLTELTPEALAEGMWSVYSEAGFRSLLSEAAMKRAEMFTPDAVVQRISDIIDPPEI